MNMSKKFKPESQLTKHGWKAGAGLGRSEDGIKEAVIVKLKFDQAGVGHDVSEQFTYHWWDHVFNKAANSISVHSNETGVSVKTSGECQITNKKGQAATDRKALLYGSFVKASTLTDGVEEKEEKQDSNSSESDSAEEDIGTASKLTDEQLMKICGGRTAHKAARHGLGLNGKLARIAQQEQNFVSTLPKVVPSPTADTAASESGLENVDVAEKSRHKRKKSKSKREEVATDEETEKKKSKKKKKKEMSTETEGDERTACDDSGTVIDRRKEKQKRKKSDRDDPETPVCKPHSKKKRSVENCNGVSDCDGSSVKKKKKKKKSKDS